jgi:FkbM family methyltransferase
MRLVDRVLRGSGNTMLRARVQGVEYELDTRDLIDFNTAYLGQHDRAVLQVLSRHLASLSQPVLWDVGANVGCISLRALRECQGLRVEAFEPSPAVVSRLRRNASQNPELRSRLRVHELAVSNQSGLVEFFPTITPSNSGMGALGSSPETVADGLKVRTEKGDQLIQSGEALQPTTVKIDVEGFELEVLKGLTRLLSDSHELLVVLEHEPTRLAQRGASPRDCIEFLERHGFEVQFLDVRGTLVAPSDTVLAHHGDLVATRRDAPTAAKA